jgi:uncharacterized protein with HEPN domain
MSPDEKDAAYLWDMREAARETVRFLEGLNLEQFIVDRRLRLAVERELEIIGEAARRVSRGFQDAHPDVPWRAMIGQRNVLAHDYGEIDPALVWNVADQRLPELIAQLDALVPPVPDSEV